MRERKWYRMNINFHLTRDLSTTLKPFSFCDFVLLPTGSLSVKYRLTKIFGLCFPNFLQSIFKLFWFQIEMLLIRVILLKVLLVLFYFFSNLCVIFLPTLPVIFLAQSSNVSLRVVVCSLASSLGWYRR